MKLLLPLIYAGFFVVQLFINFDTALNQKADRYQLINHWQKAAHPVSLEKTGKPLPVKTKFRLNKNFQPTVVSELPAFVCCLDIQVSTQGQSDWNQPFFDHPVNHSSFLRGPPAL